MTRSASPVVLTKTELVERLARQADHYGVTITEGLVDRWIEGALLAAGERRGNVGRRPRYEYGASHYRRALQLARFYGRGMKDRDAILVQLFVRGYSVAPHEVRDPLRTEYHKAVAMILAPLRGDYSRRPPELSDARRRRLRTNLGPLDPRIAKAGFELSTDDILGLFRLALAPEGIVGKADPPTTDSPGLAVALPLIWPTILGVVPAFMALDDDYPNPVEEALNNAGDGQYYAAAHALNCVRTLFAIFDQFPLLAVIGGPTGELPGRLVSRSLLTRELTAFALAMFINLIRKPHEIGVTGGLP